MRYAWTYPGAAYCASSSIPPESAPLCQQALLLPFHALSPGPEADTTSTCPTGMHIRASTVLQRSTEEPLAKLSRALVNCPPAQNPPGLANLDQTFMKNQEKLPANQAAAHGNVKMLHSCFLSHQGGRGTGASPRKGVQSTIIEASTSEESGKDPHPHHCESSAPSQRLLLLVQQCHQGAGIWLHG